MRIWREKEAIMERDLEFIKEIEAINIADLSEEKVCEYFFFHSRRVLFVTDEAGQLSGIITFGEFCKQTEAVFNAINSKYLFIKEASVETMKFQAQEIYDTFMIQSDIPVINQEKKLMGYVIDHKFFSDRVETGEKQLHAAIEKLKVFKKSYYLNKEMEAFCKVMAKTEIYARSCRASHELFAIFDNRIPVRFLEDEDYLNKLRKHIWGKNALRDREKLELFFDFKAGNGGELCHILEVESVYGLERFISEFTMLAEREEFSRILRITKESLYNLKKFISDNELKDIHFAPDRLLAKYVYDYMGENNIPVVLAASNGNAGIHASGKLNGVRGPSHTFWAFALCDTFLQQHLLTQAVSGRNIHVFHFWGAVNARLTKQEEIRVGNFDTREILIESRNEEALKCLYQDDCGESTPIEYARELWYPYPVRRRFENDIIVNADYSSRYINIENGIRRTYYQPKEYVNTIYITGACYVLGLYVEDRHTISSLLSKRLTEEQYCYRVVNLGILVANDYQNLLNSISLRDGDIIVQMGLNEKVEELEGIIDPSGAFDAISERDDMFFEASVHCNRKGNEIYADVIYDNIKHILKKSASDMELKKNSIYDVFRINITDAFIHDMDSYLVSLRAHINKIPDSAREIGSIVMNCNPFTLGHRHLIEYASKNCDYFFVFVVEEDKSFFKFEDRIQMVRDGCEDIRNVSIVRSGKVILSDLTLPEYFQRESVRDDMEIDLRMNAVIDLLVFARYIAPVLGITKRFVAEEILDSVTRQYNEEMRRVLPFFNIQLVEIPRKTLEGGQVISASQVRKLYKNREFDKMKKMVPDTTWECLVKSIHKYL